MDKYKVIAEKITYSLDGYIADHNNRNFGDADGWLRHVRNGWEEFIEAHPDSLNLHEHLQHQQAKVEELQVQLKGAEERAQLVLQYKDKYRLERDELQKRIDVGVDELVITLITMLKQIRANPHEIIDMSERQFNQHLAVLEQALKGGGNGG